MSLRRGLRAPQSRPVYVHDRKPYGTFVLAYREARNETHWDVALMTSAADAAGARRISALKKVTEGGQRFQPVADDLGNRQHWDGEDRTGHTPQPEPENQ